MHIPTWQCNMMTCGPFSRPICCDSSSRDWWFPGRNSPEFFLKVSKVKHIAPACCQQALKPTLLHSGESARRALIRSFRSPRCAPRAVARGSFCRALMRRFAFCLGVARFLKSGVRNVGAFISSQFPVQGGLKIPEFDWKC